MDALLLFCLLLLLSDIQKIFESMMVFEILWLV